MNVYCDDISSVHANVVRDYTYGNTFMVVLWGHGVKNASKHKICRTLSIVFPGEL